MRVIWWFVAEECCRSWKEMGFESLTWWFVSVSEGFQQWRLRGEVEWLLKR
ncbi:hypothetical protein L195_g064340, partial [Trifolium pratense]